MGAKAKQHDAIEMLKEDHKKVQGLFKEFESTTEDREAMQGIVHETCAQLMIHAQLEEEIFYPAVRESLGEEDLLDEAEVEHSVANELIQQLLSMEADDQLYAATYTVLGEYVTHHIREEQDELFPKVKKAGLDLSALGERMMTRKQELERDLEQGEEMPPPEQGARRPEARH